MLVFFPLFSIPFLKARQSLLSKGNVTQVSIVSDIAGGLFEMCVSMIGHEATARMLWRYVEPFTRDNASTPERATQCLTALRVLLGAEVVEHLVKESVTYDKFLQTNFRVKFKGEFPTAYNLVPIVTERSDIDGPTFSFNEKMKDTVLEVKKAYAEQHKGKDFPEEFLKVFMAQLAGHAIDGKTGKYEGEKVELTVSKSSKRYVEVSEADAMVPKRLRMNFPEDDDEDL